MPTGDSGLSMIAQAIDLACLAVQYRQCAALDPEGAEWFTRLAEAASADAAAAIKLRHEAASHSVSALAASNPADDRIEP